MPPSPSTYVPRAGFGRYVDRWKNINCRPECLETMLSRVHSIYCYMILITIVFMGLTAKLTNCLGNVSICNVSGQRGAVNRSYLKNTAIQYRGCKKGSRREQSVGPFKAGRSWPASSDQASHPALMALTAAAERKVSLCFAKCTHTPNVLSTIAFQMNTTTTRNIHALLCRPSL